jgi:carboxypeptidase D
LGDPYHAQPAGSPEIYFDRPDVQTAIHAPAVGTEWSLCSDRTHIFVDADDRSPPSATNGGPLGHVIERTNNVIVGHGLLDMVLMAEGSLLALQNLTWNGARGFSSGLDHDLLVPYYPQGVLPQSGNGTLGSWTEDRGLTFSTVVLSGHEVPGYQPGAAYRHLEKLLGRIARLDEPSNFTTAGLWFGPDEIVYERTILPARPMLQRRR